MRQLEVRLKPWEARRLKQLRNHAASARVVKRAVCLLLSAAGQRTGEVARVTGLSRRAIAVIRRRWRQRRLRSVRDRPRPGRPPRITVAYRRELRRALRKSPLDLGYVFTVWSIARLGTYLRQRTGIALGANRLRQVAHEEGFVVARPRHTLAGKRDEREYRRTRRRLERLKRGRRRRARPSNSGTPTPRRSTSCRTWSAAGCPRGGNGP
jgi:transposase